MHSSSSCVVNRLARSSGNFRPRLESERDAGFWADHCVMQQERRGTDVTIQRWTPSRACRAIAVAVRRPTEPVGRPNLAPAPREGGNSRRGYLTTGSRISPT